MAENSSNDQAQINNILSESEKKMQFFLEDAYGLTEEEFVSIVMWLDNFGLKFDSVERFEQVEDSLVRDFSLTSNDIFSILFSHGDVFCKDYAETKGNFEYLNTRYKTTKKDFADMLKVGAVIDRSQAWDIENGLKTKLGDVKWVPMANILKNTIEYVNVDYAGDIAFKIDMLQKFGISYEDINGKFEFLKMTKEELITRLKLMCLTNELPMSFLNVGHRTPTSSVFKLFLKFEADKDNGKKVDYSQKLAKRKRAESFDDSQPLSEENVKEINNAFASKFKKIQQALIEVEKALERPAENANNEPQMTQADIGFAEKVQDVVESGKQISYIKKDGAHLKKTESVPQTVTTGQPFVKISPEHKFIWTYMVKNFGLSYQEYPEVLERINLERRNRLKEQSSDIEAVFADVSKDFQVSRKDFGQFFKYTLYGMAQRLALLECFGITPQDLAKNNYANASIMDLGYDQLEYMLKVASIGKVNLEENLGRMAKYNKDTFLAKYIKFAETGVGESMLDTPMTEKEYQDIIRTKAPVYKRDKIIETRYAEAYPVSSSFLEGYNENQRNLLMIVGFLIKKYGMSYVEAKKIVEESSKNFNEHTKFIQAKLDSLENLGYEPRQIIQNSSILRIPEDKALPRAILAKYLGIDEETFLKHYVSTSEAKVFARMMGAMDIKPSYYYASEKVFSGLTGLSTDELMAAHKMTIGQLSKLKRQIFERESKQQMEAVFENGSEPIQIFDTEKKLPAAYTKDELDFRLFMQRNYGIDSFEFNNTRNEIGAKGLNFLNVAQMKQLLPILKRDFDIFESEDIARLFKNNPRMFTNGFADVISKYGYFEDNFEMTRNGFRKMIMYADSSMVLRDDLVETYNQLKEMMLTEYGIELTKRDFVTIIRNIKCGENYSVYTFVDNALKLLKNYQFNPSEINSRYNFMMVDDLRTFETRLMLSHLLGETPNSFFKDGCYIQPNVLIDRYLLYKKGKIEKSSIWLRTGDFEALTGEKIDPEAHIPASKRIEIAKDFTKKVKNVSFAPSAELFSKKMQDKKGSEIIIRSNDYLTHMLASVLGADYKIANTARSRNTKFADVYARFMGVDQFLAEPNRYYLPEYQWQKLTGLSTLKLKEMFPITDETAEIIKRAYFEKFPEDAFGRDSEFAKKLKELESVETQKTSG